MAAKELERAARAVPKNVAIIFGVTGLVGRELAKILISTSKWKVYGIARRPHSVPIQSSNYQFISCDLLNPQETAQKLSLVQDVTHMFWVTWASQYPLDTRECCEQNKGMMRNALNAVLPNSKELKHVSLQTGMKHYISLKGSSHVKEVCFDEECPRVNEGYNFYYALEDLLAERLAGKVAWSVLRPCLLMGCSSRTSYNVMGSLCVYGAICRHLNLPFVFGGTRECWEDRYIDCSDARLVAEQHIWAATNDEVCSTDGQAFNAINGPSFTWKEIWAVLGDKFGVVVPGEDVFSEDFWFAEAMSDKKQVWQEIVEKEGLQLTQMEDLASWEFLDILFRLPRKLLGSREKTDRLGFTMRCKTLDSVLHCVDSMRDEKLIP
ncbi:hypothetical protein Tsubulata_003591 [Turnera subulata]|uniref:PRISE-like Rossmann-fold domain-containing protein n=1 Tax=Turnera subulata TaxID=218843 RepID=A0A9Q0JBG6_9ROSI|nr:hypothetical protein Tsubulata_003591 [Turnera subulata]